MFLRLWGMRFYESTSFFLRVIVVDYFSKTTGITLRLMPMFHIGEPSYYDAILKEANDCEVILYENMDLRKRRIDRQWGRYTQVAKQLNLVSQIDYFPYDQVKPPLIHADLKGQKAQQAWNQLSWKAKLEYRIIAPLKFRLESFGLTRQKLSKAFMTAAEEAYLAFGPVEEVGGLEHLLTKTRDQIILETIQAQLEQPTAKTIGLLYGAAHMKRVAHYLTSKHNFIIQDARFIRVYDL
ncbi:MAG: hypothetical protein AAF598_08125 [Bacteroidota bacterium]